MVRTVDVLLVIFLSVLLGVYLRAIANFLHRRWQVPETVGLLAGVALTIGALVGLVFLVAPAVSAQVQDLLTNLPQFLTELDATISRIIRGTPLLRDGIVGGGTSSLFGSTLSEIFGFLRGAAVPYLKGGVEFLIEGVSVLVMALYFARSPESISTASSP